ncbi:Putative_reverse transcriptase/endonuclease [Hexamita inflata]|uniref:Reverse transcriptase/endonuclease n=1 Tax=Hexamita inflata TaxID=28002 RepID=A0AA86U4L8_9EUKA|nr:Putative reverse transcriptase/endonuclease [Hexamita inflata]
MEYYSYKQFLTSEIGDTSVTFLIIPLDVRKVREVYNIFTNHQKFLLLRSVVLPKVNCAPLVDFAPKTPQDGFGNQYGLIDQKVFKYASDLFAVKDLSETEQADFFTNSASKGGLEMVVPSLYYDFMQAQQKAVLAGGVGIFKALRKEYLNTLQDHPGVPAIGYAINNFTYLTHVYWSEIFVQTKINIQ